MGKRTVRQAYASWASSKAGQDAKVMLLRQQLGFCYHCRCPITIGEAEMDHLTPISQGGRNDHSNLYASCRPCNKAKGNKLHEESIPWWLESRYTHS